MSAIGGILFVLIRLFSLFLLLRIVIEMVESFSRNWRPQRWFMIVAEPIFVVTDPPLKFLRRRIPPLQMGGVGLDMSVLALFIILMILSWLVQMFLL